jgi:hypothetical protein
MYQYMLIFKKVRIDQLQVGQTPGFPTLLITDSLADIQFAALLILYVGMLQIPFIFWSRWMHSGIRKCLERTENQNISPREMTRPEDLSVQRMDQRMEFETELRTEFEKVH